ncbi:LTA synthase family protein [Collinsella sp. zg1085]|uniref:LTA synthase family protein n=1 Tax=Collinsella sp. zg1085 TaxID=2844380 RepID=UPI001C0D9278|nr:LTA synthase family protein [Collinsella sp. zg1085]QWT18128.1 LTA synthase family protein [Collinsella sp. zg1085]
MSVAVISSIALVVSLALAIYGCRAAIGQDTSFTACAWTFVFVLIQLCVAIAAYMGMVVDDIVAALVLNAVLVAAVALCALPKLRGHIDRPVATGFCGAHPLACGVGMVLLASIFTMLALEIPSNHELWRMYPLCALLEWAIIALPMLGLYLIFQRRGSIPAILTIVLALVGIAEFFTISFKSQPIQPGDLSALTTAAAVSTQYEFVLSAFCLYGIACAGVALVLLFAAGRQRPARNEHSRARMVAYVVSGLVLIGALVSHVSLIDYYNALYVQVYSWRPLNSYYQQGFLPCFISSAQTIAPKRPRGYKIEEAQQLMKRYAASYDAELGVSPERAQAQAQFEAEKPSVVTIMNETFSDLSMYQQMHAGYEGPQFFKSLSDTLQRGILYVSAYGGGTANSEFEYLTGNSMAYMGAGVYPYTIYDMTRTENLARQFKELGYETLAMHPNHATNWNRENVYKQFGFDTFMAIKDFAQAERLRGMVTDKATYDSILDVLSKGTKPQFIFDVTMQNHSGYETQQIPPAKQLDYPIDGQSVPQVNEYLSLINESDKALEYFIAKLRQLDRKVVLVFFGDHQPFFPDTYNDAWFTGEPEAVHTARLWQTSYFIWANYDVAGREQKSSVVDLSTNYLSANLMHLIGAPLSDYQKAHMVLQKAMPAINMTGFEDEQHRWYLSSAGNDPSLGASVGVARNDLAKMQFFEMFRDGKNVFTKMAQAAANETNPNLDPNPAD